MLGARQDGIASPAAELRSSMVASMPVCLASLAARLLRPLSKEFQTAFAGNQPPSTTRASTTGESRGCRHLDTLSNFATRQAGLKPPIDALADLRFWRLEAT